MKIIRFLDAKGEIRVGERIDAGSAKLIEGDIFGAYRTIDQTVTIKKLLAPVVPTAILCIGLNYRAHAEETGAKLPKYPVLFMKAANALTIRMTRSSFQRWHREKWTMNVS